MLGKTHLLSLLTSTCALIKWSQKHVSGLMIAILKYFFPFPDIGKGSYNDFFPSLIYILFCLILKFCRPHSSHLDVADKTNTVVDKTSFLFIHQKMHTLKQWLPIHYKTL